MANNDHHTHSMHNDIQLDRLNQSHLSRNIAVLYLTPASSQLVTGRLRITWPPLKPKIEKRRTNHSHRNNQIGKMSEHL